MTVTELIKLLQEQDPNAVVVIERDDDYWHIADVDTAILNNPTVTNPTWDFDRMFETDKPIQPNAVRICM